MAQHMLAERAMREGWAKLLEDLTGLDWTGVGARYVLLRAHHDRWTRDAGTGRRGACRGRIRHRAAGGARTGWTCPILACARRGDLLVPPVDREAIVGLGGGSIRIVDAATLKELLAIRGVGAPLVEHLGAVIRDRQESLRLATVSPQRERVRQKLLQLARSHGRVRADGVRIALPLTHDVIARAVGSSRETVTLAMRELRREGFLARSGRSYMLRVHARELDPPAGASAA
jgi:Crp-like helix-turn-helix domain